MEYGEFCVKDIIDILAHTFRTQTQTKQMRTLNNRQVLVHGIEKCYLWFNKSCSLLEQVKKKRVGQKLKKKVLSWSKVQQLKKKVYLAGQ